MSALSTNLPKGRVLGKDGYSVIQDNCDVCGIFHPNKIINFDSEEWLCPKCLSDALSMGGIFHYKTEKDIRMLCRIHSQLFP